MKKMFIIFTAIMIPTIAVSIYLNHTVSTNGYTSDDSYPTYYLFVSEDHLRELVHEYVKEELEKTIDIEEES